MLHGVLLSFQKPYRKYVGREHRDKTLIYQKEKSQQIKFEIDELRKNDLSILLTKMKVNTRKKWLPLGQLCTLENCYTLLYLL